MDHRRNIPLEMDKSEFKKLGYQLIDTLSDFLSTIDQKPITSGETPRQIQKILGEAGLPEQGKPASELFSRASDLLLQHSLFNGHPKFMGYITGSPAPIGILSELLASTVNPNVGANILSPMATAIEKQTIQWLAEFIGLGPGYGGILMSGGNMANFNAFLAARTAKAPKNLKEDGLAKIDDLVLYCSKATHTWIEKAAVLFGHGSKAIRWIATDTVNRMKTDVLAAAIQEDLRNGKKPFLVIGTAGDVSTGAVDDFSTIAKICKDHDLWFHIDGAYGIPAAVLPDQRALFKSIGEADSIAIDPHK